MEYTSYPPLTVIGLMSGTSLDGVDACLSLVTWREHLHCELQAFRTYPIPIDLRQSILLNMVPESSRVDQLCELNVQIGEWLADAVLALLNDHGIPQDKVDLIGSHGQTLYHQPSGSDGLGSTLQLGEPSVIAARTGITTFADFRPADMAVGGQGAPLVPWFDAQLFRSTPTPLLLQNIGGIANLTYLPGQTPSQAPKAFDTGPGNVLIDTVCQWVTQGKHRYDPAGQLAAAGQVYLPLLEQWLQHPYFAQVPPKSTGRELFGEAFARQCFDEAQAQGLSQADILATVTALTAHSIARSYTQFLPAVPAIGEILVSGGGVHNQTLMQMLRKLVAPIPVLTASQAGLNPDAKESMAFAAMAYAAFWGIPNNLPQVTGASAPVVMGKMVAGQNLSRLQMLMAESLWRERLPW